MTEYRDVFYCVVHPEILDRSGKSTVDLWDEKGPPEPRRLSLSRPSVKPYPCCEEAKHESE